MSYTEGLHYHAIFWQELDRARDILRCFGKIATIEVLKLDGASQEGEDQYIV